MAITTYDGKIWASWDDLRAEIIRLQKLRNDNNGDEIWWQYLAYQRQYQYRIADWADMPPVPSCDELIWPVYMRTKNYQDYVPLLRVDSTPNFDD